MLEIVSRPGKAELTSLYSRLPQEISVYVELGIISWRILYLNANVRIGVLDLQRGRAIINVAKKILYFLLKIGRVITEPIERVQKQGQDDLQCEVGSVLVCFDNDQDSFICCDN